MKEKDGLVDCPEQQVILYVEKENGKFEAIQTGSYITGNFLDDYNLKREHLSKALLEEVTSGKKSPIHYFMVLEDLSFSELCARVGLRKRKVRKHLEPGGFRSLDEKILQKYADVFNVSVKDILSIDSKSIMQ